MGKIISIDSTPYEVPQAVFDCLKRLQNERDVNYVAAMNLQLELNQVRSLIKDLQLKEQTAAAKGTKAFRLLAWRPKKQLYMSVAGRVEQLMLM